MDVMKPYSALVLAYLALVLILWVSLTGSPVTCSEAPDMQCTDAEPTHEVRPVATGFIRGSSNSPMQSSASWASSLTF